MIQFRDSSRMSLSTLMIIIRWSLLTLSFHLSAQLSVQISSYISYLSSQMSPQLIFANVHIFYYILIFSHSILHLFYISSKSLLIIFYERFIQATSIVLCEIPFELQVLEEPMLGMIIEIFHSSQNFWIINFW